MSQFEFLMTFASVILAIGLSEVLGGFGRLIRSDARIRWSPLWAGWTLSISAVTIVYWAGMWPYRDESFSEGHRVFWLSIPTLFLTVACFVLSPEIDRRDSEIDLEARYWKLSRRFLPVLALFLVTSIVADQVILERPLFPASTLHPVPRWMSFAPVLVTAILLIAAFSKRAWLHWIALLLISLLPISFLLGNWSPFR